MRPSQDHPDRSTLVPSVRVGASTTVTGPAWIGHGCVIRSGAKVTQECVVQYTRIAADMHFSEMIVSRHYCVDRYGETLYRGDDSAQLRWGVMLA